MKKGFVVFLMALGMVSFSNAAFASVAPATYVTDSNGGSTPVSTFTLDQQPWLFVSTPVDGFKSVGATWWNDSKSFANAFSGTKGYSKWLTNTEWNTYLPSEKLGSWKVLSSYAVLDFETGEYGPTTSTLKSFKVVAPEPISALLFLLGGAGLGIKRFFIKK
jgi:hypothetical protein